MTLMLDYNEALCRSWYKLSDIHDPPRILIKLYYRCYSVDIMKACLVTIMCVVLHLNEGVKAGVIPANAPANVNFQVPPQPRDSDLGFATDTGDCFQEDYFLM